MRSVEADTTLLLERARSGSDDALEALYARCAGKLLPLIRLRLGRKLRAELESRDILQATLLKSFQRLDEFQGGTTGSLLAWLARIAQNEMLDQADFHARKRRDAARKVPLDEDAARAAASPARSALSQIIWTQEAERLEEALDSLEDDYREVILLRKFEELSFNEIGKRMSRSEDACRMLLARALTALTLRMRSRDRRD